MATMYLIQRRGWDAQNWNQSVQLSESLPYQKYFEEEAWEGYRMVPVAVASTQAQADSIVAKLETEARESRNPLWFDSEWQQPANAFFSKIGVNQPSTKDTWWESSDELTAWWDEHSPAWTDEQRDSIWKLFKNLWFYEVTQIEMED